MSIDKVVHMIENSRGVARPLTPLAISSLPIYTAPVQDTVPQRQPSPTLDFEPVVDLSAVRAALVWAFDLPRCAPTLTPPPFIADLLGRVRAAGESFLDPMRKAAVRDMLRFGSYKPAGRSKPSSEYLLAAALQTASEGTGAFPLVNGPVDVNNAVSLEWGYPASIFDAQKSGWTLLLRRGSAGESFVFNKSGQSIDLHDLLCVCRRAEQSWKPCGNPVKDAMETKVFDDARSIVAIVYAPTADPKDLLAACAARFSELLKSHCGAAESGWRLVPGS